MKYLLLSIIFVIPFFLVAEEKEKVISIDQERSETLLYGIDMEVKELLVKLTKEKITGFNKELKQLLESAFDESLKIAIFEYFTLMEISDGEKEAYLIYEAIEYEDEYSDLYATASIKYLSSINSKEAINNVNIILESDNKAVLKAALKLIGKNIVKAQENKLLEMLEDIEVDDQIFLEVIKALGQIKSSKALEILIPIADDEDEETTVRNAVCFSLGEIGDKKAIPVLKRCLSDRKNYLLRRSALKALGKFSGSQMNDILIEALRDPQWQIRYEAIKALGERKVEKAFGILKYKALKDPEVKIQKQAFKTIGDINSDECREFLKEVFTDSSYKDSAKLSAIDKLIEHNVDWIFPSILELYKEKNMEKRKPLLDVTLKLLSKKEYKYASDLYGKMLTHENYIYKILAIQGIRLNEYAEHKELLEKLSVDDKNKNVKKHALSALEEL